MTFPARAVQFTSDLITNLPTVPGVALGSNPSAGAAMGGYFYFAASDGPNGTTGRELWRTDGTPSGTTLVKDIRPGAADSAPDRFVASGTNLFFVATDGVHGRELWKSDGTAMGTVMVKDLNAGPGDSLIEGIKPVGNGVCFYAALSGLLSPSDLFRSDGTAAGTLRLTGPGGNVTTNHVGAFDASGNDIALVSLDSASFYGPVTNTVWRFSGSGPYLAYPLATLTNRIYSPYLVGTNCYFVTTSNYDVEDSTWTNYYTLQLLQRASLLAYEGPVQRVDSSTPNTESAFLGFAVTNGRLFYSSYSTDDPINGTRVYDAWKSVGETGSPVTIAPNGSGALPIIGSLGGYTYYQYGSAQVFRTDGKSAGIEVIDFSALGIAPYNFLQAGSRFFFQDSATAPYKLGVSDLTPAGTLLIENSVPGTNGLIYGMLGALGSSAVYQADSVSVGREPYVTDGTTNDTLLLKDIAAGNDTPAPTEAVATGDLLFFTLDTPGLGVELWKSDGTPAGTQLVKDIRSGTNGSSPSNLTAWNGMVYFTADDGTNGTELWRSDGTAAGTLMVKDVRPGSAGSNPSQLTAAVGQLFFVANDGAHGAELWRTDGTGSGTYQVQDIVPGVGAGNIRALAAAGSHAYFLAGSSSTAGQLWYSTGNPGDAQLLIDFGVSLDASSWPRYFTRFGGHVYFGLGLPSIPQMWRTDDTPAGTVPIAPIGNEIAVAGSSLFASDLGSLWTSDGTSGGSVMLTNLSNSSAVTQLTPVGSNLYFTLGHDLWFSDGTTNGTGLAASFSGSNYLDLGPANFTPFEDALVFTAWSPLLGRELWCSAPGQGATPIEDLSPQTGDANIAFVCAATNRIFYLARPAGQSSWEVRALNLRSIAPPPQGPFGGTPWPVPGHIEAEDFDTGGEGRAYHDATADNEGGQYRPYAAVDIESCDDAGGGFCVYQTQPGEWLDYTIQVAATGLYELDMRLTSGVVNTGFYHLELDGVWLLQDAVLNDGNPGGWYTESVSGVPLTAGIHTLRLVFDQATSAGDVGVYNWLEFTLLATNQPPVVTIDFPPNHAILPAGQTVLLRASVDDTTSAGAPKVEFFLDDQSLGIDSSSPYSLAWTPTPGAHILRATATDSFGATSASPSVLFFVGGQQILSSGAFWRVNDHGTNAGTAWRAAGFDDSNWPRGRSPLGFGYADLRTLVHSNIVTLKGTFPIATFYFRQSFNNDLSGMNYASITLTRDDAAVVYVNGQELARLNLPEPPAGVRYTTLAVTNVVNYRTRTNAAVDVIPVPFSMLSRTSNVIAVEIHQAPMELNDRFDLKFDLALTTYSYAPNTALSISVSSNAVAVRWPDYLTDWMLEQSMDLRDWSSVTGPVNVVNGSYNLYLNHPSDVREFFRLHQMKNP